VVTLPSILGEKVARPLLDYFQDIAMPTLYVEKVSEELYEALRRRAREHGKSITAEVISLLEQNIPTAAELARRRKFLKSVISMRSRKSSAAGPFPSTEEMVREDRLR
jgi:plasmid stability protein